jgi:PPM family protein phosphatase
MSCSACGAEVGAGDRYCEACGHRLGEPVSPPLPVPGKEWLSSAGAAAECAGCGGTAFGPEGYCDTCGRRRPAGPDHSELDLGALAGVSDRGHRHHRNEDAMAVGRLPGAALAVVCDGVSSSTHPDAASHAAVAAAAPTLLDELEDGTDPPAAISAAARAAQAAAALVAGARPGSNPPSCTFVCAVATVDAVTVGWVGDSRAYWLPDDAAEAQCLTTDDSLAGQLAAAGVAVPELARSRQAGALVRWLGADATDTAARLHTFAPPGPGRVLLCSDGLSRYARTPADLAAGAPGWSPLRAAGALVRRALDEGGEDNVTAVLITFPPEETT